MGLLFDRWQNYFQLLCYTVTYEFQLESISGYSLVPHRLETHREKHMEKCKMVPQKQNQGHWKHRLGNTLTPSPHPITQEHSATTGALTAQQLLLTHGVFTDITFSSLKYLYHEIKTSNQRQCSNKWHYIEYIVRPLQNCQQQNKILSD